MEEVTVQAAKAIAYRDCVFKLIPAVYIREAKNAAMETVDNLLATPAKLNATKKWVADELKGYGVTPQQLKDTFGDSIAAMTASQLKGVLGLLNSLRSGYSWDRATGGKRLTPGDGHVFRLADMDGAKEGGE